MQRYEKISLIILPEAATHFVHDIDNAVICQRLRDVNMSNQSAQDFTIIVPLYIVVMFYNCSTLGEQDESAPYVVRHINSCMCHSKPGQGAPREGIQTNM